MLRLLAFSALLLGALQSQAFDHTHASWDAMLKKYVTETGPASTVNYKGWKSDTGSLDQYLASLSAVTKAQYDSWTEDQKMAFLINAYNAFTVKLILNHYPVKSIKKIGGVFSSPWKQKFFKLLGEDKHLDNIEHDILRKDFKEARIHFGVVCASIGCPKLQNEAFVPQKLREQLEAGAKEFLADTSRNKWTKESNKLEISNIFKWFKEDFIKETGSVAAWVAPRMGKTPDEVEMIKKAKVGHLDYDWNINETP